MHRVATGICSGLVVATLFLALDCSTIPPPSKSVHPPACMTGDHISGKVQATTACTEMEAPTLIDCVDPDYPKDIRRRHLQGKVVASARLTADGVLEDFKIESSPWPELSQLALDAFRQWRYKPALCRDTGKTIPVRITTTLTFTLN